jgi:hypothetical protein
MNEFVVLLGVYMFYIAPFMHSEDATHVEKPEKSSDFLNLSDISMNKAPTVQMTTDATSNTSYAIALSRLSQSFSHNATLYQQANELFKDTFRPAASSLTQGDSQPQIENYVLNDIMENDSVAIHQTVEQNALVNAQVGEKVSSQDQVKSQDQASFQEIAQQSANDFFSAFYEHLNYNAFDTYREMTQSFLSKSLNAYTTDAMHSYWVNTLFPSPKALTLPFANVWSAMSDPFLRPLGLDSVSLRPAPTNVFEAWMRPWLSAPVKPVAMNWLSAFSPMQSTLNPFSINPLNMSPAPLVSTTLWQQCVRMMWAR